MKQINKNMMIEEAISINPKVAELLLDKGVHCIGCGGLSFETLEMGLKAHGMSSKDIDELIKRINSAKGINITDNAHKKLKALMKKNYKYLRIKEENKKLGLSLEKIKKKNDLEIKEKGIKVIFDKKYSAKANGVTVDYLSKLGGFAIK